MTTTTGRVPVTSLVGVNVAGRAADVRTGGNSTSWPPLVRPLERVEIKTRTGREGKETWVYWYWTITERRLESRDGRDWFSDCGYSGHRIDTGDVPTIELMVEE